MTYKDIEEVKSRLTTLENICINAFHDLGSDKIANSKKILSAIKEVRQSINDIKVGSDSLSQIQIITTSAGIQDFINSAVQAAFNNSQVTTPSQSQPEKPITVKELCDYLRVTEATVIRWRKKGKIPFMQLGSRIMFNKSEVIKAIEKS